MFVACLVARATYRESLDELMSVRLACCEFDSRIFDLGLVSVACTIQDVVTDRAVEQSRLLADHANLRAQPLRIQPAHHRRM